MVTAKPSWLDDLETKGYAVVPGVIPQEACDEFVKEAWDWLESFPYGFKRDDRSTWTSEHLPHGPTGGLYNRYSVNHEAFVWKIRIVPEIQDAFGQVWGTDDLIASFDGMNATLPINAKTGRSDVPLTDKWPHIDQSPHHVDHLQLCQGIANLAPNGPKDGGLVVMMGSHRLHQRFFDEHGGLDEKRAKENGYRYELEDLKWFESNGCKEIKICAGPGDLLLWDSRTIHWNASPTGSQTRFATYVAYTPRRFMTEDELAQKLQIFKNRKGTTGWAHKNVVPEERTDGTAEPKRPDGTVDPANRDRPRKEPAETPEVMWAVGVR